MVRKGALFFLTGRASSCYAVEVGCLNFLEPGEGKGISSFLPYLWERSRLPLILSTDEEAQSMVWWWSHTSGHAIKRRSMNVADKENLYVCLSCHGRGGLQPLTLTTFVQRVDVVHNPLKFADMQKHAQHILSPSVDNPSTVQCDASESTTWWAPWDRLQQYYSTKMGESCLHLKYTLYLKGLVIKIVHINMK